MERRNRRVALPVPNLQRLQYLHDFLAIQRALTKRNIPCIHLKGLLQSLSLTGRWPKRLPLDIDILILRQSFPLVSLALARLGYRPTSLISGARIPDSEALKESEVVFLRANFSGIPVDVHLTALASTPSSDPGNVLPLPLADRITREFLLRSRVLRFRRRRFRVLEDNDLLLYQCLNFFFNHSCRSDHQLGDIALIVRKLRIRWDVVVSRLTRWSLGEFAYYPLRLARDVGWAPVPPLVLKHLRPRNAFARLAPLLVNRRTAGSPVKNVFVRYRYNVLLRFLLLEKPFVEKIAEIMSPAVVARIIRKPRYLAAVFATVFRAVFPKETETKNTAQLED